MNYDTWHDSGKFYANIGMYKQAIHCYEKAIKISPRNPVCWEYKGIALASLEKFQAALFCFDKVIGFSKASQANCADSWYNKGRVYAKLGDLWNALLCYNECLRYLPNDDDAQEEKQDVIEKMILMEHSKKEAL
jgi:tetratricopeptide (TPR) repeat protein